MAKTGFLFRGECFRFGEKQLRLNGSSPSLDIPTKSGEQIVRRSDQAGFICRIKLLHPWNGCHRHALESYRHPGHKRMQYRQLPKSLLFLPIQPRSYNPRFRRQSGSSGEIWTVWFCTAGKIGQQTARFQHFDSRIPMARR
mgnify:CR=1 FL=1